MKIVSSPNAFPASRFASSNDFIKFSSARITLMPRPPPPALAFKITGRPIRFASCNAISADVSSTLLSSITGTSQDRATNFDFTLSPNWSMTSGDGPIKIIPSSRHLEAKRTFSERNP